LSKLRPAFTPAAPITAGSASPLSDGAAALVVMSAERARRQGLSWLAEIGAHGMVAGPDSSLHSQPARAIRRALEKEGRTPADLDLVRSEERRVGTGGAWEERRIAQWRASEGSEDSEAR